MSVCSRNCAVSVQVDVGAAGGDAQVRATQPGGPGGGLPAGHGHPGPHPQYQVRYLRQHDRDRSAREPVRAALQTAPRPPVD